MVPSAHTDAPTDGESTAEEAASIEAVRAGEPEAVDAWFRREHPVVYRLSLGFLANAAEAEDLAQDAMLHLFDKLSTWDARRSYRTWRDTVVLNLCRDRARRIASRDRAQVGAAEAAVERAFGEVGDPHEGLERREMRDLVLQSLELLSPREREVFVLRDLEQRTSADAARALDVTESTVRSLLTLARRRLRSLLGERLFGEAAEGGARV